MGNIKTRLLEFIARKESRRADFYRKTGITRGILNNDSGLTEDNLVKVCHTYPEINLYWLVLGEGEMYQEDEERIKYNKEATNIVNEVCNITNTHLVDFLSAENKRLNSLLAEKYEEIGKLKAEISFLQNR